MNGIRLPESCRRALSRYAESAYPEECCGVMLGSEREDGTHEIVRVIPVDNTATNLRERRFLIDPGALLLAEKAARLAGLKMLGVFHSHPDQPARPTDLDRRFAAPDWSYVIVSCEAGKARALSSWRLRDDGSAFEPELLD